MACVFVTSCGIDFSKAADNYKGAVETVTDDNESQTVLPQEEVAEKAEVYVPYSNGPDCWQGRNIDEFAEYVKSQTLTEEPHTKTGAIINYSRGNHQESDEAIYVMDNTELDVLYGYREVSIQQIKDAIAVNSRIPQELKYIFSDFAERMMEYYPDLDMRNYYENVKNVNVYFLDEDRFSGDCEATYTFMTNSINLKKDFVFEDGAWETMVLRHELGHMIIDRQYVYNNKRVYAQFMVAPDFGYYTSEPLDVLLTTEPFMDEYSEEIKNDLDYIMSTNIYLALLKLDTNFRIEVQLRGNERAFEEYLDSHFTGDIDGNKFVTTIDNYFKYRDSENYDTRRDVEIIGRYVAGNYINLAIRDDMKDDEVLKVRDALKYRLSKNVLEDRTDNFLEILNVVDTVFDDYLRNR